MNFYSILKISAYQDEWKSTIEQIAKNNPYPFSSWFGQNGRIFVRFKSSDEKMPQEDVKIINFLKSIGYYVTDYKKGLCRRNGNSGNQQSISKVLINQIKKIAEEQVLHLELNLANRQKQLPQKIKNILLMPFTVSFNTLTTNMSSGNMKTEDTDLLDLVSDCASAINGKAYTYYYKKNNFQNSQYRNAGNAQNLLVCFTQNPHDVAKMSTQRGWTSCMRLPTDGKPAGEQMQNVFCEVAFGGFSAYLINDNDKNIQHPLARMTIKRFQNKNGQNIAIAQGRVYGTAPIGFKQFVTAWLQQKQGHMKEYQEDLLTERYHVRGGTYSDSLSPTEMASSKINKKIQIGLRNKNYKQLAQQIQQVINQKQYYIEDRYRQTASYFININNKTTQGHYSDNYYSINDALIKLRKQNVELVYRQKFFSKQQAQKFVLGLDRSGDQNFRIQLQRIKRLLMQTIKSDEIDDVPRQRYSIVQQYVFQTPQQYRQIQSLLYNGTDFNNLIKNGDINANNVMLNLIKLNFQQMKNAEQWYKQQYGIRLSSLLSGYFSTLEQSKKINKEILNYINYLYQYFNQKYINDYNSEQQYQRSARYTLRKILEKFNKKVQSNNYFNLLKIANELPMTDEQVLQRIRLRKNSLIKQIQPKSCIINKCIQNNITFISAVLINKKQNNKSFYVLRQMVGTTDNNEKVKIIPTFNMRDIFKNPEQCKETLYIRSGVNNINIVIK